MGPTTPLSFAPGSAERAATAAALAEVRGVDWEVVNVIGGKEVRTERRVPIVTPHEHKVQLGTAHWAGAGETQQAIDAALAAGTLVGPAALGGAGGPVPARGRHARARPVAGQLNAATMLELSKTTYQADIDAACETLDFIRANVKNMLDMYGVQPSSRAG